MAASDIYYFGPLTKRFKGLFNEVVLLMQVTSKKTKAYSEVEKESRMPKVLPSPNVERQNSASPPAIPGAMKVDDKAGHLLFLDGLRALAALVVVSCHSLGEVWPPDYGKAPAGWMAHATVFLQYGHYAVALFIVLSGFSLMLSVTRNGGTLRGGTKAFFLRRARRILPPYYFALTLSLLLASTLISKRTGTHWDCSVPFTMNDVRNHVLLIQDIGDAGKINHALWSISIECHYYLLFPLLVWGWRKIGGWTAVAVFAIAVVGIKIVHLPYINEALFPFFALFAFGMLAETICFDERKTLRKLRDGIPWLSLAIIFALLTFRLLTTRYHELADYPFGIACLSLLIAVGRSPGGTIRKALNWRPLVWLGGFSYSLYLIHAPLIQLLWQYVLHPLRLSDNATFLLLIFTGTPLFVVAAYGFYWYCERPFLTSALKKSAIAKGE